MYVYVTHAKHPFNILLTDISFIKKLDMITVPEHFGGVSHLYYLNETDNGVNYTGVLVSYCSKYFQYLETI